jgi:hypothetical protein
MIDPIDGVTQQLPVTTSSPIRMRFASQTRNYTVLLTQGLFSTWTVVQTWSGKYTKLGGGKIRPVESFEEGREMLLAIEQRRRKHHYVPID